jgi:hypothetical protein
MARLPADRTKLNAAVQNQQPSIVADAIANREALIEAYDTIDMLYNFTAGLVAGGTLQPYPHGLYRNAIINGNFDVWQRGTIFGSGVYTADRWLGLYFGSNTQYSRETITDLPGSQYAIKVQNISGQSNFVGSIVQRIESVNAALLYEKTVTLSFKVKCTENKTFSVMVRSPSAKDNFSTTNTRHAKSDCQAIANTWSTVVFTFPLTDPEFKNGIEISIGDQNVDQEIAVGGYYLFAQVQLNVGDIPLPFQPRSFAEELALCQRYYQRGLQYRSVGTFYAPSAASIIVPHIVPMRIAPTLGKIPGTSIMLDDIGVGELTTSNSPFNIIASENASKFDIDGFTGANPYRFARLLNDSIYLDAEL